MTVSYLSSPILDTYTRQAPFVPKSPYEEIFLERVSPKQYAKLGLRSGLPDSRIGRLLASRVEREWAQGEPTRAYALSASEFRARTQELATLAAQSGPSGFILPRGLNRHQELEITHLDTIAMRRTMSQGDPDCSFLSEMLLLAFEATPRPVSYAMSGYMPGDWLAYMYQDVALNALVHENPALRKRDFDAGTCYLVREWLGNNRNLLRKDSAKVSAGQRHTLQRLEVIMGRSIGVVRNIFEDRNLRPEMVLLARKLLEMEDGDGYLSGAVRPFEEVRADWNALAEYVMRRRMVGDEKWQTRFLRTCCPSVVLEAGSSFENWILNLPTGSLASSSKKDRPSPPRKGKSTAKRKSSRQPDPIPLDSDQPVSPDVSDEDILESFSQILAD